MLGSLFTGSNLAVRTVAQFAVVLTAGTFGLSVASSAASAGLDAVAYNTAAEPIATGTMSLTLSTGLAGSGFGYSISAMAPGDTVTVLVNLANGSLPAQNIYLAILESPTANTLLTRDGTKGLKVNIDECSSAWTVSYTCSDTTTSRATNLFLHSINQSETSTLEQLLIPGAIAASTTRYLRFQIILPDQNETTTNGQLPSNSIQNLSTNIVWKFRETQRAATSTNG